MKVLWTGVEFLEVKKDSCFKISFSGIKSGDIGEVTFILHVHKPFSKWSEEALHLRSFYSVEPYCTLFIESQCTLFEIIGRDRIFLLALFLPSVLKFFYFFREEGAKEVNISISYAPPVELREGDKILPFFTDDYFKTLSLQ